MTRTEELIRELKLNPHPEGGYFSETYRCDKVIRTAGDKDPIDLSPRSDVTDSAEPENYPDNRSYSTAIYYLLEGSDRSHFHRIRSDEVWHHYEGSAATIHVIRQDGSYRKLLLGPTLVNGERFQQTVSGGDWFAVTVNDPDSYLLAGCTVAPGFDFRDFEMAKKNTMLAWFPDHRALIEELCL